jgi:hypothetical protein
MNDYNMLEYSLVGRAFTWSNGHSFALLDRFISSLHWDNIYSASVVTDLSKYSSYHCPLVLNTQHGSTHKTYTFRFDREWTLNLEFNTLMMK